METEILEIDARGLEPPQPLVRILEALGSVSTTTILHARTDRRPIHLYPMLRLRGFCSETTESEGHGFLTVIRRAE
ncbi:MAG: DUF2249 domain-containing protein [Verrucomicrobiales bacterium]|nr:DUF2249 domain-containing protein [Verrucomicrobiales bacterium]